MKVVALKPCFVNGAYYKIGDLFEVNPDDFKKDAKGKPIFSRSSTPPFKEVTDVRAAQAEAAKVKQAEEAKQKAAAVAVSGGRVAKEKVDATRDLVG